MAKTAPTAAEIHIRHSPDICAGEHKYTSSRKNIILNTIKALKIDCAENSVPHIALLGSGGGERATVAMLGSTDQLVKEGLFDTLLYTGGISGSTWAMSSLYSDPHFEIHVKDLISKMHAPDVPLDRIMTWLEEKTDDETFSLTDVWAVVTTAQIMKQLELRCLSEEAGRNATNPYPVYCAVERESTSEKPEKGHWFEVSPHESGYTELDLFVDTAFLGSEFAGGCLLNQKREMDMVKLQGICGSALADWKIVINYLLDLIEAAIEDFTAIIFYCVYRAIKYIIQLIRGIFQDPDDHNVLVKYQLRLEGMLDHPNLMALKITILEEREDPSPEQLLQELEEHCQNLQAATGICQKIYYLLKFLKQLLVSLLKWEWGNIRNFLYSYNQADGVPPRLVNEKIVYLIDAGLWMNVPYPPFLGDKRDIDLIIAPDFSAGQVFETLTLAKKYAQDRQKPFPEIDDKILQERDFPKDCYVFEGKAKEPTIVYMPLFNRANCADEAAIQTMNKEFHTFQWPYSWDKVEKLLNIARDNIKRNRTVLLEEIQKAISRKRLRSSK